MDKYTSLIIDIKGSRKYSVEDRTLLQYYLVDVIEKLNVLFKPSIVFDITFSAGDELQGLFANTMWAVVYLRLLEIMVHPVQIRAGIGVGEWNVKIEGGISTQQDGPAYHMARAAIEDVYKMQTQRFKIYSDDKETDIMASYLLNVSKSLLEAQNMAQNRIQLISEIMYPFIEKNSVLQQEGHVSDLLEIKENYNLKKSAQESNEISKIMFDISVEEPIYIIDEIVEAEKYTVKKNAAGKIAEVLKQSRQNIDTVMRRGKTIIIRNMDYVALQYIKRNYGGMNDL